MEEILNKPYISAQDIKKIIPTMGINKCHEEIDRLREIMKEKNLFIPTGKTKVALTKIFRKEYGL